MVRDLLPVGFLASFHLFVSVHLLVLSTSS